MKKEYLLLLLLLLSFLPSTAQESVTLTFTANTQSGMYCHFDAVNVTNVTRGWTETLMYPDTTLVLGYTTGVNVVSEQSLRLGEAYPNPFTYETNVPLEMPNSDFVFLQVVRVDGLVVATSQARLDAGSHLIKVRLSNPSTVLLVVTSSLGGQVARMVCISSGGSDSITVGPDTRVTNSPNPPVNAYASGEFLPGDMMQYTAVLFDGVNTVYSNTLSQQQNDSQLLTLTFDLTLPQVITNQVIDIAQNFATGVGEVVATGGVSVTERGICWSMNQNPTVNNSHATNGIGVGIYTVPMEGLTADTTYYVRAYAVNALGTAYGNEVSFNISQFPGYTISVSANPASGGTVTGGGTYEPGQNCAVEAHAAQGNTFLHWTENGTIVSTDANYTFTVTGNRSLEAQFKEGVLLSNSYLNNALIGHPQIYRSDAVSQSYVNINSYTATGSNSNTDLYHKYDELASTYPLYFKRTDDLATVTDSQTGISYTIRSYEMNYNNRWMINHEPTNSEVITSDATNYWDQYGVEPRKIILVSGVHGEEHVPTWGMMLALQEILSSDEDWAHFVKDNFVFKIIPCLNPAGWSNCRRGNSVYDATANPPHYHVLNRAESMGDPEAVAYLNFMEANKDAFVLIDNHGSQGHYMYLPKNYNVPIADLVNLMATKLSSTIFQNWYDFYESFSSGYGTTYAPYCVARTIFSQQSDGNFSTRAYYMGLHYMNTETPDNLDQGGSISNNDLRCCKLTKDLIINILQMICPLPSLGGRP